MNRKIIDFVSVYNARNKSKTISSTFEKLGDMEKILSRARELSRREKMEKRRDRGNTNSD